MDYKSINDYELLYLIKENDDSYKNAMFDKYELMLHKLCNDIYNEFYSYGIEYDELYQEALIGLNSAIEHFNSESFAKFSTYAVVCINSKLQDYIYRITRNKYILLSNAISLYTEIGENLCVEDTLIEEDKTYNYIIQEEKNKRLINFKNTLSLTESQVFELRYNGFSYKEIAILLDLKSNNIYSYIRQIRNKGIKNNISDCIF